MKWAMIVKANEDAGAGVLTAELTAMREQRWRSLA